MSKIIYTINYIVRALGLFGITASLAFALLAAPAAPAAAASGANILPEPGFGQLVVAAFNTATGRPVAGASLAVINSAGVVVARGTTPATGSLTFTLRPGDYKVIAKAPGFTIGGQAARVIDGQVTGLKVGLSPVLTGPIHAASN
jgi:hypothetical protein